VNIMRRGLLALLALIGASSMGSAQAQFVPPPGLTIQTTTADGIWTSRWRAW